MEKHRTYRKMYTFCSVKMSGSNLELNYVAPECWSLKGHRLYWTVWIPKSKLLNKQWLHILTFPSYISLFHFTKSNGNNTMLTIIAICSLSILVIISQISFLIFHQVFFQEIAAQEYLIWKMFPMTPLIISLILYTFLTHEHQKMKEQQEH